MKQILTAIVLVLALNFLAVLGGLGYLVAQHKLDREKFAAIKEMVFPKPATEPAASQPTTEESAEDKPLGSFEQLTQLLAANSGKPAGEQVEVMQHAFDAQAAVLDRRQRELTDLKNQLDLAKLQLERDKSALDIKASGFESQQKQAAALASDKGFKESLELYKVMPPKQVKTIFMGLDDATVTTFLTAMEPKLASKILKEFKSPEESDRVQKILERIRQAQSQATAKG